MCSTPCGGDSAVPDVEATCDLLRSVLERLSEASPWEDGNALLDQVVKTVEIEHVTGERPTSNFERRILEGLVGLYGTQVETARQAVESLERLFCAGEGA